MENVAKRPAQRTLVLSPDELSLIRRHVALSVEVLQRFATEGENAKAAYDLLVAHNRLVKRDLDEIFEEIERINRLLILEETGRGQGAEAREIRSEIRQELSSLEWQLTRHIRNLQYLQEQAAGYGSRVPLDLVNEITDEEEKIQELQTRIRARK